MPIPLNTGAGAAGPPSIKLRNPNDWLDAAIINVEVVPAYVYGTRDVAKRQDGTPKSQERVTVLVIGGTGVITEDNAGAKADRPIVPDEVATIYFEGQSRWDPDLDKTRGPDEFKSWGGAKERHGQLNVGDVFRWMYERDVPGKGQEPRKVRTVKLRRPRPDEAARTARCEQLHREGTAIPVGAAAGAPDPRNEPFLDLGEHRTDFRNPQFSDPWL